MSDHSTEERLAILETRTEYIEHAVDNLDRKLDNMLLLMKKNGNGSSLFKARVSILWGIFVAIGGALAVTLTNRILGAG